MKNLTVIFILVFITACHLPKVSEEETTYSIIGTWAFLDGSGNYNEAVFNDTAYLTCSMNYGASPYYLYVIKNDSLYSDVDKRRPGLNRIAQLTWLEPDKVIFVTQFTRDTLERIKNAKHTLQDTDPVKDSLIFAKAIRQRYEDFLVSKKIISLEEIEQFKRDSIIPDDVLEAMEK